MALKIYSLYDILKYLCIILSFSFKVWMFVHDKNEEKRKKPFKAYLLEIIIVQACYLHEKVPI